MSSTLIDEDFMRVALELAAAGEGFVEPNPMVGCVLVKAGRIIGRGYHKKFGSHHAEVEALLSLVSAEDAKGCTAYVTLEPCCHQGKTPPCTGALIGAGVARVVVAMQDPFAEVDGGGLMQLRDAGIDVTTGVLELDARQLTSPFAKLVRTGRPWVIAKWAMTMDGRIATRTGDSQWISGQASRGEVHKLRGRVDAIVVGMGTVVADDPMLNARPVNQSHSDQSHSDQTHSDQSHSDHSVSRIAQRVVLCGRRLPAANSRLMKTAKELPVLLVTMPLVDTVELTKLEGMGAKTLRLDTSDREEMIGRTLEHLGKVGATNVMVEGGAEVLSSFFSAGEIDEAHVYVGPKAFGGKGAAGPIGGMGVEEVSAALPFNLHRVDQFDDDVRLIYRQKTTSN